MAYLIETTIHYVRYHDDDYQWMNGERRGTPVMQEPIREVDEHHIKEFGSLKAATLVMIGADDYPVIASNPHHEGRPDEFLIFLAGKNRELRETTIRLTGDWTNEQRADIFAAAEDFWRTAESTVRIIE